MYGFIRRDLSLLVAGFATAALAYSASAGVLPTGNLIVQLEGDQITGEVAGAFTWDDQAALGGSNSAATSVVGKLPTIAPASSPNGLFPTVSFDGSDFLNIGANSVFDTNTITWMMVVQADTLATQHVIGSSYTSLDGGATNPDLFSENHAWGSFIDASKYRQFARTSVGGIKAPFPSGHTATTDWFIITGIWNGDLIKTKIIDASNIVEADATITGANGLPSGHKHTRLGADPQGGGLAFDGQIGALLIFDSALGAGDEAAAQQYLYDKYFVPEPGALSLMALGGLAMVRRRRI